jgi:hypothetical protein
LNDSIGEWLYGIGKRRNRIEGQPISRLIQPNRNHIAILKPAIKQGFGKRVLHLILDYPL